MQRSRRAVLLAALATVVPLAGCGTDRDDDRPPTTDETVTTAGETTTGTTIPESTPAGTPTDGTTSADPSTTGTGTATTLIGSPEPSVTVAVSTHAELGDVLVGPDQRSVYAFDGPNTVSDADACTGSCKDTWPPLTPTDSPTAGPDVEASVGTIGRPSGIDQVTVAERPLYTFVGDETPGDARGQGVGGTWWVLRPDGSPVRE